MSAAAVGPVKAMILALEAEPLRAMVDAALDGKAAAETLRQDLTDFAERHAIPL
jgi:phosphotransferase system enzyme I (PtsP)